MLSDSSVRSIRRRVVRGVMGGAATGKLYGCPTGIGVGVTALSAELRIPIACTWRALVTPVLVCKPDSGRCSDEALDPEADRRDMSACNFCWATLLETGIRSYSFSSPLSSSISASCGRPFGRYPPLPPDLPTVLGPLLAWDAPDPLAFGLTTAVTGAAIGPSAVTLRGERHKGAAKALLLRWGTRACGGRRV